MHVTDETVGSYRLLEKLGEGGMGEVYSAEHKYIERRAAIKFLLPELTGSSDLVGRFFAEARAASVIKHPGIVEVLDCDVQPDGRAYIVMELLDGESLRDYLERVGKLDADEPGALAITLQMVRALAAAHAQGIIHRDLKPDNAFLHLPAGGPPDQPVVKLLDFGIAKLQATGEAGSKTRTGQLLGTPLYMSPEQCRGARQIDSRSDIYSLGCMIYEIFCGRPPFIDEGFGDLIVSHISRSPPEPLELAPTMTPMVREIVLRCLSKHPESRPATMRELETMLANAGAVGTAGLRRAVEIGARPRSPAVLNPRLPKGRGPSPDRLATTPFPQTPRPGAPVPRTTPAVLPRGAQTPAQSGGTKILPTPVTNTLTEGASEVVARPPRRSGGKNWAVIGAAILGTGGLAAAILMGVTSLTGRTKVVANAPEVIERPAAPVGRVGPKTPAPTELSPEPSDAPAWSSIRLTGLPVGAAIFLDGQPAPAPLVVPRKSESHRLAIEAAGFERWEGTIDGGADRSVAVALTPKRSGTRLPAKAKHRSERTNGSPRFTGFDDL